MRKLYSTLTTACLVLAACSNYQEPQPPAPPQDGAGASTAQSIVIIHTNDIQSRHLSSGPGIENMPISAGGRDLASRGGLIRLAAVMQRLSEAAALPPRQSPVVVVDSGSRMGSTLFSLSNLGLGIDYAIADVLRYDVLGLGVHDLELGARGLATMVSTAGVSPMFDPGLMRLPLMATNLRFSKDSPADDMLESLMSRQSGDPLPMKRTLLRQFGDVKVGFVGVMGIEAAALAGLKAPVRFSLAVDSSRPCTSNAQCPGSECLTPPGSPAAAPAFCARTLDETAAQQHFPALVADTAAAVAQLRAQGADLVVALSSAGVDEAELAALAVAGRPAAEATRSEDILLAKFVNATLASAGVPGLDVIVGGFSGTALHQPIQIPNGNGTTTYVVQAGKYGEYVGHIRLTRATPQQPWSLDPLFTGLAPVNEKVDVSRLSRFTEIMLRGVLETSIKNMEGVTIAQPDGIVFPGEQCDGTAIPNDGLCAPLVNEATGGRLSCGPGRQFDLSGCIFSSTSCGDGVKGAGEMCDGTDLGAQTCASLGYDSGQLRCLSNCGLDVSQCVKYYPSLLEAILDLMYAHTPEVPRKRDDRRLLGDLFFSRLTSTSFDVPMPTDSRESNLSNLVADAARWSLNQKVQGYSSNPVRATMTLNWLLRSGLYKGRTNHVSLYDAFAVLPLGVSPQENSPGWSLADFYLTHAEFKAALESLLQAGLASKRYWPGLSGVRIGYDPSKRLDPRDPIATGRITRITLVSTSSATPWGDGAEVLEAQPLFELTSGGPVMPNPNQLIRVGMPMFVALMLEAGGLCPRSSDGQQLPHCSACTQDSQCVVPGSLCGASLGRCVGVPGAFARRTTLPFEAARAGRFLRAGYYEPFWAEELKDFYSLVMYLSAMPRSQLPEAYNAVTPRRLCCAGDSCSQEQRCRQ